MKKLIPSIPWRSSCPIATTLDLVGDRWTLLIIRDIGLFDKHRYKDFQESSEGIPTNILADRLKLLVDADLVEKVPYQDNPPRYQYHLTDPGKGLLEVVRSMAVWAGKSIKGVNIPDFSAAR
jgi:DNA-binding HxlR family transcriptional regulator